MIKEHKFLLLIIDRLHIYLCNLLYTRIFEVYAKQINSFATNLSSMKWGAGLALLT